jgi:hypothetical protein
MLSRATARNLPIDPVASDVKALNDHELAYDERVTPAPTPITVGTKRKLNTSYTVSLR